MIFESHDWSLLPRQSAEEDWATASETFALYLIRPNDSLLSWVGSNLELMRRKVTHTLDALRHVEHLHRVSAIFLLRDYWPKTELTTSAVANLPFSDCNPIVRAVALHALSDFYGWISDPDGVLLSLFHIPSEYSQFLLQRGNRFVKSIKRVRDRWESSIGPLAQEMLGDLSLVEQSLQSNDPLVRHAALYFMATEMQPSSHVASVANQIIQSSPEPSNLRKVAVSVLGRYRRITKDTSFDGLFVSLVRNELYPDVVRAAAYLRLFEIRRLRIPEHVLLRVGRDEFRFPDDVDWSFVSSFS